MKRALLFLLAAFWLGDALLTLGELVVHLVSGTSSTISQVLRLLSGLFYLLMSAGIVWRFPGWKLVAAVGAVLEGFRNYALLAIPIDPPLNLATFLAVAAILASLGTLFVCFFVGKEAIRRVTPDVGTKP